MKRFDAIVCGAGMVGIATALHLQQRGAAVALVDRRGPAEETSFGNAGLIQAESVMPYAFPRDISVIANTLLGRNPAARVVWQDLPATARWLVAYAKAGSRERVMHTARASAPLITRSVAEHRHFMTAAQCDHLARPGGYLEVLRGEEAFSTAAESAAFVEETFGISHTMLDRAALGAAEPHLDTSHFSGAIHYPGPVRIVDPGALGKAYAALFEEQGGTVLVGDAAQLDRESSEWSVPTAMGRVTAPRAVIALGPWSGELMARFGCPVPLGFKRGYHIHMKPRGNAVLNTLVADGRNGFVLGPNVRGIRLTTGAEFARRDRPPSPVQLHKVMPLARDMFPLDEPLDDAPWLGVRPCFPDLLPAVGPVGEGSGLWANIGHQHHGFTLGPVTGRLLAEMMMGEEPFTDPAPYAPTRF